MTTESNSDQAETQGSEILNDNDPAVDETATGIAEEVALVKKKVAPRKKAGTSSESRVKKTPPKRSRSTKIDGAESSPSAPAMKAFWGVLTP